MTSMSSGPCVLQFMQTDISRSWAGLVSCKEAEKELSGAQQQLKESSGRHRHMGLPWKTPHTVPTFGFCSHISSRCTVSSRTSL